MPPDNREIAGVRESSATKVSELIHLAIVNKLTFIQQTDEAISTQNSTKNPEAVSVYLKEDSWSVNLEGYPVRRDVYPDGVARFQFDVNISGHRISPQMVTDISMDIGSSDLPDFEVHEYRERRTLNLDGGGIYTRVFEKQSDINPNSKNNRTREHEGLTLPYKGDRFKLAVFINGEYEVVNIDSLRYYRDENGMWIKDYGIVRNGYFQVVTAEKEFTEGLTEIEKETGQAPPEFYYQRVPVIGKELEEIYRLVDAGRKLVGPRDQGLDNLVKWEKK